MPTFNRAGLLERSIISVLNQSFTDWELIVVDDGSTDNTFRIVDGYLQKYEKIKYIKHSNRKTPLATNTGIAASSGRYLTFLGSDDEYKKDHLKLRFDFMEANPAVDLIHGGIEIIGHPFVKDKYDLTREIHISECVVGGTFFGKRDLFFELGGFRDLRYSDDSDFYERARLNHIIRKVDWPTYIYYRDTPDSICSTIE
jgi:glycosyltransferase involved in cell wall biosynthesis